MSLVGTRPPTVDEWEQYELHHRSRMSTKPGMEYAKKCNADLLLATDPDCEISMCIFM